ncbi:MAG: dihydrodipicolinate synthase family protein, partial [Actinomycetota bacterium]|nr:dihydrodipicolinate synthase family protein [Actinomycetota bacterium]
MDLAGVSAAVPTPFHDDGTLDQIGLAALVEAYGEAGAERMAVLGSNGEGALLDERERNTVISTARAAASGLPLFIGVAAGEPRLDAAQQAEVAGADVLLVELTGSQTEQHLFELETLAGLGPPLVLDHHPGTTG